MMVHFIVALEFFSLSVSLTLSSSIAPAAIPPPPSPSPSPPAVGSRIHSRHPDVRPQADVRWKFLHAAPPHYTTLKLTKNESIVVDGRLDDLAWSAPGVEWTTAMVDITRHNYTPFNHIPDSLQARAKLRWDANFLYSRFPPESHTPTPSELAGRLAPPSCSDEMLYTSTLTPAIVNQLALHPCSWSGTS